MAIDTIGVKGNWEVLEGLCKLLDWSVGKGSTCCNGCD